jgi:hypothetical protein
MTIREQIKNLNNNGTVKFYNDRTKEFVQPHLVKYDAEVKNVNFSKGYGCGQINATIREYPKVCVNLQTDVR